MLHLHYTLLVSLLPIVLQVVACVEKEQISIITLRKTKPMSSDCICKIPIPVTIHAIRSSQTKNTDWMTIYQFASL